MKNLFRIYKKKLKNGDGIYGMDYTVLYNDKRPDGNALMIFTPVKKSCICDKLPSTGLAADISKFFPYGENEKIPYGGNGAGNTLMQKLISDARKNNILGLYTISSQFDRSRPYVELLKRFNFKQVEVNDYSLIL